MPSFKRPVLVPGALNDLVSAIHELHLQAGQPSVRTLKSDIGGTGVSSHTSIHKLFTQDRIPSWGLLELVVEVMAHRAGLDEKHEVERFRALWAQAARPGNTTKTSTDGLESFVGEETTPKEAPERIFRPLIELLPNALDEIEALATLDRNEWPPGLPRRVPTGFTDLDALLGGWSPGSLIVVGGQPSSGKTTLLLNFCRIAAIKYKIPAMLISGELNNTELQSRLLSAEGRVPILNVRNGRMEDEQWTRLARVLPVVSRAPLNIGTPPKFNIEEFRVNAEQLAKGPGLELIVVDSLQWLTAREASNEATAEAYLWQLKDLAADLKVPVILSAQMERYEKVISSNEAMQHLRFGSAIERVADIVIVLDRPDQHDLESWRPGEADLIVAKHRNGPTATITVGYQYHYCRLLDMLPPAEDGQQKHIYDPGATKSSGQTTSSASAHDRELRKRLLASMPPDGKVISWLKDSFMLKAFPSKLVEDMEDAAKKFGLEPVDFDDEDAKRRYADLRAAIDDFCSKISWSSWQDPGGTWLEVPTDWRDKDRAKYDRALAEIGQAHDVLVEAYDQFLKTCHEKGIDCAEPS